MTQDSHTLSAHLRETVGKKVKQLRREGLVPAVLYGYGVEPTNLQVVDKELEATFRTAGGTALVDLQVEGNRTVRVFLQEVQRHPITQAARHVDFHAVNLQIEITSEVPIVLLGESPAVHNSVGILLRGAETVTVHALPAELPQHVEISVENLTEVDQALHVSDLHIEGNYQITSDPGELIVRVAPPQLEPEVEAAPEVDEAEEAAGTDTESGEETAGQ